MKKYIIGSGKSRSKLIATHDLVVGTEYPSNKTVQLQPLRSYGGVYVIAPTIDQLNTKHTNAKPMMKIGLGMSIFQRIDSYKTCFPNGVYEIALLIVNDTKVPNSERSKYIRSLEKEAHTLLEKKRYEPIYQTYVKKKKVEWFHKITIANVRKVFEQLKDKHGDKVSCIFPFQE
jgi:hypothetical protein